MAHSTTRWLLGALAIVALALAIPAVTAHDGAPTPYGNDTTTHNATAADAPPANATAAEWEMWMESHMGVSVSGMAQLMADSDHIHGAGYGPAHGGAVHGAGYGPAHSGAVHGAGYGPAQGVEYGPHAGGPAIDQNSTAPIDQNSSTQGYHDDGSTQGYHDDDRTGTRGHGCH
jgi:hypothetical protein